MAIKEKLRSIYRSIKEAVQNYGETVFPEGYFPVNRKMF
jgi:hypothetical protein